MSALSALGAQVGWLTQLGNDIFSRYLAEHMEALGLSSALTEHVDEPLPVVTAGVSFPHDRLFLSYRAPLPAEHPHPRITEEHLDCFRPRVLFTYGEVGIDIMQAARARGIAVVVDTFWSPETLIRRIYAKCLRMSTFSPQSLTRPWK